MDSQSKDDDCSKDTTDRPVIRVGDMARQGAVGLEDIIRSKIGKIRHWKMTSLGKKRPKWGFEFTVMTYNILSQAAVNDHMYLYFKCNPQFLSEEYRMSRILPEILKSKSDVVCLQEVEQHLFYQRISKVFDSNGFSSIFKKRTSNKSDGCAILWRRAKFNLLNFREVEFKRTGSALLNRDNVGLVAVLKPRHPQASKVHLHIGTTHLIYNPRRGDVKLCQLRLFLAELERLTFRRTNEHGRTYHPTILCGDFNMEPHSPLYKFVEEGRLDLSGLTSGDVSGQFEGKDKGGKLLFSQMSLDKLGIDESGRFQPSSNKSKHLPEADAAVRSNGSQMNYRTPRMDASVSSSDTEPESTLFYHDFNFVPAYKYYNQDRKSLPVTSMPGRECSSVDHIFYNVQQQCPTSYKEGRLELLGVYTLPCGEDLREVGGLPNAHLGSDHVCLMSKFMITF